MAAKEESLFEAVKSQDVNKAIQLLYSSEHVDLSVTSNNGRTLLHEAASLGSTVIVVLLLEKGIDVELNSTTTKEEMKEQLLLARDEQGCTPLELAINNNHCECALLLAKKLNTLIEQQRREFERRGELKAVKSLACAIM